MCLFKSTISFAAAIVLLTGLSPHAYAGKSTPVQLGPRPFYLVDQMTEGDLKQTLQECAARIQKYRHHDFSIGHRGAALQFPEHTQESYVAARRMGAGILECDVTFTADGELVCRHDQCDLHTTTNIVATPLGDKCSQPFTPADPAAGTLASARCCASDITLEEFKTLKGKMDASDRTATTPEGFLGGTADFRTDLYATGATLLSHAESIELFRQLGAKFTPELKAANPDDLEAAGLDPQSYASKMIQEYIDAGIDPRDVFPQSFFPADVLHWIEEFPDFGEQAVLLDGREPGGLSANPPPLVEFQAFKAAGVNIVAPPMSALVQLDADGAIVPSGYATRATQAGLKIISWTSERSGRLKDGAAEGGDFYYRSTIDAIENDGDILRTIDVLAQDVGIIGLFSDWPATTSFYANCLLRKHGDRGKRGKGRNDD